MRTSWTALVASLALVVGLFFAPSNAVTAQAATSSDAGALAVSGGLGYTCAITVDHTVACWGTNSGGAAHVAYADITATAVSAGGSHAYALLPNGTLYWWGTRDTEIPQPSGTFSSVSAGGYHDCAIRTDGTLACWGYNGDGAASAQAGTFTSVSAGWRHTCAIRTDGTLACWGEDIFGETDPPAGTYTAVAAGRQYSCAIATDETLSCWGSNNSGQATPPTGTFTALTAGSGTACAIGTDQTIACWGYSGGGAMTPPAGEFTAVSSGTENVCAIGTAQELVCWGTDYGGSTTVPSNAPSISPLPTWLSTNAVSPKWGATPRLKGVASYDVRYRRAPRNGGFGSYTTWRSATAESSSTFNASPGYTYCFSVRVRDIDDHVSGWTAETCTSVPLDDRSLTRSSGWTAGTGTAYYRSTYVRSSRSGAKLTRAGVAAKRIALLATTCPTCGSVKVYLGSTLLKTISLHSATTVNRKLITVKSWSSVHSGTLKVQVKSSGKKVIIDGIAIRRS